MQWMEAFLTGFIEDNGVDVYRQDFNIEPLEIWRSKRRGGPRRNDGAEVHRQPLPGLF